MVRIAVCDPHTRRASVRHVVERKMSNGEETAGNRLDWKGFASKENHDDVRYQIPNDRTAGRQLVIFPATFTGQVVAESVLCFDFIIDESKEDH